jgi:hypothetical protein
MSSIVILQKEVVMFRMLSLSLTLLVFVHFCVDVRLSMYIILLNILGNFEIIEIMHYNQ